jgi:UPF0176 protein
MEILNIAAYKFVSVPDPKAWLIPIKESCDRFELKGTIILAHEGINLCLAGASTNVSEFISYLQNDELFGNRFKELDIKESISTFQPFRKMVVREARETITLRQQIPCPSERRAPALDAETLKNWLDRKCDDNGRELLLLDTRDAFEVKIGTFENAISFPIEHFSQFPDAIQELMQQTNLSNKTIVSFCTGGIRCEKAVLYMEQLGLHNVFQLDGGILRYFEKVGGAHWQGECFVFDERIALDPSLQQTKIEYQREQIGSTKKKRNKRKRTRKRERRENSNISDFRLE